MHGRGGGGREEGRQSRHMWPVPDGAGAAAAPPASPRPVIKRFADGFLLKDGRKIHIGDCALFQSGNSPAFIGIIRSLSSLNEDLPKLIVNWLYRPADIKLAKGTLLEAAPNEVFYSFHKDEISAESLLHPCKVAFLRKGAELPSGISSFVCRRVYDIANKCLWWLTDQDYTNERQEEVDQLLGKTQVEMNAAVQSGGKQLNGSTPVQQLKSGSDSMQNSGSSGMMHVKGKRRDKVEHNSETIKKEHAVKADGGDSGNLFLDGLLRDEVAKLNEKGSVLDTADVDKLVSLMQLDKDDRKIDLAGRLLLVDVIAAISPDRLDCLGRFVQQKGLLVLDDWLQEAHKGKIGENSSPKDGDKSHEELVLALLRALDKLPVNLHALQTSNIGKSVNNLRSHKNLEIQKKARILVDTWKKRVDAEFMKNNDAKPVVSGQSVSWSSKPGMPETTHGGGRRMGDVPLKNSNHASSTFKNLPVKSGHGDSKSITASPGSKSSMHAGYQVVICTKDTLPKISAASSSAELQLTPVKEEKSSGSSQSQNNNHSSFTNHTKTSVASRKDDVRSLTSGFLSGNKVSGGMGRHRKSNNGLPGTGLSGGLSGMLQKESGFNKAGNLSRVSASNKISFSGTAYEHVLDPPVAAEQANGHRLIVRLPNPGKSPARSSSGGSFEELLVVGSGASSPCVSEKHDQVLAFDKGDSCHVNETAVTNAEQISDKRGAVASDENVHTLAALHRSGEENGKPDDIMKDDQALNSISRCRSLSGLEMGKELNSSLSPMNALIESCVKAPELLVPLAAGDDLGMNLLASVATEEMLKSELACSESSLRSTAEADSLSKSKEDIMRLPGELDAQGSSQHDRMGTDMEKNVGADDSKDEPKKAASTLSDGNGNDLMLQDHMPRGGKETSSEFKNKSGVTSVMQDEPVATCDRHKDASIEANGDSEMHERCIDVRQITAGIPDEKQNARSSLEEKQSGCNPCDKGVMVSTSESDVTCSISSNVCHAYSGSPPKMETVEDAPSCRIDTDVGVASTINGRSGASITVEHQPSYIIKNDENIISKAEQVSSCVIKECDVSDPLKLQKANCAVTAKRTDRCENETKEPSLTMPGQLQSIPVPLVCNTDACNLQKKDVPKDASSGAVSHKDQADFPWKESGQYAAYSPNIPFSEQHENGSLSNGKLDMTLNDASSKLDFDLNEGINIDEIIQAEVADAIIRPCSTAASQPSVAPISISTASRGCSVTLSIPALAKGPFMPPENLSRSKDESGWKGSAATSAFRPAEPRKILEMPAAMSGTLSGGKQNRPSLDIDLNVADARIIDDAVSLRSAHRTCLESCSTKLHDEVACNAGLCLDLNKADEASESTQNVAISRSWEPPRFSIVSPSAIPNGESNCLRDFDLNDGPGAEISLESVPQNLAMRSRVLQFLPTANSLRPNGAESGNFSSWFPAGTSYPAVAIPPLLSDRGDVTYPVVGPTGTQRFLGSSMVSSLGGDHYRGTVLSSSPAMAFPATNPFTHPVIQFPSAFPMNSASFTGVTTTYGDPTSRGVCLPSHPSFCIGSGNASLSPYVRPYVISLSDSSASGGGSEGARKWSGQNLDLNAGPGISEMETRTERLVTASHPMSISSQPTFTEEAGRIYQTGGGFKRKEPEGGWDAGKLPYKQSPWQ